MQGRARLQLICLCSGIFGFLCFAVSEVSFAKPSEVELEPGEAFVIVSVGGLARSIRFQMYQGKESFRADLLSGVRLTRVKPGRYYLARVDPYYTNIFLPKNTEPSESSQTLLIAAGAVTYIGDWSIDEERDSKGVRYHLSHRFDDSTVASIAKKYNLRRLELFISIVGHSPVKVVLPAAE